MSKNSKTLKVVAGAVFAFAVAFSSTASAAITSNLRQGSRGAQVMELQQFLNNCSAETMVAATGPGSKGMETSTFGPATRRAVIAFQNKFGVATTSRSAGLVGPATRAAIANGCGTTGSTGSGSTQSGPVTAMLATTNPASGTLVSNQATANLAEFTFTGSGTVNSVTLRRGGLSDQNTFTNVYLFSGNRRLTDGYSFNSSGELTMTNLNLSVNGSTTVSVRGDVAGSTNGQTVNVTMTGFTAGASANTVSISGNMMSISSGASVATATMTAGSAVGTTVNAGSAPHTFWRGTLQVNTRNLHLKGAAFRMIGSAPSDALSNIKLFINGVESGTASVASIQGSNYATFDFGASPVNLPTGSHNVEIRANVDRGSSRTVQFSLQQVADFMVTDPQVGINIALSSFSAISANTVTINSGSHSIEVDPAFNSLTRVTGGSSNAVIGKFTVRGYGEDIKVNTLQVTPVLPNASATTYTSGTVTTGSQTITVASTSGVSAGDTVTIAGATPAVGTVTSVTSGTQFVANITTGGVTPAGAVTFTRNGLQNVTVYFNGSQVGTQTASWTSGAITLNLGSQMIIPAGVDSTIEVRADLRTTTGVNYTAGTVSANIEAGSSNAQGQNSFTSISTLAKTGKTLTIQTGSVAVAENVGVADQAIAPSTSGAKIGSYILQNLSSSESIRITQLTVALTFGGSQSLTNLQSLRTSETSGSGANPIQPTASNTFPVDFTLAPNASKVIDILANVGSTNTGTIDSTLTVQASGVSSNVNSTVGPIAGQTMTVSTGTVATPTVVTSASSVAQLVAAGGTNGLTDGSKAVYNFVSTGGSATINNLKFTVTGAGTVSSVRVGSTSASPVSGVVTLNGVNINVPNGGSGVNVDVFVSYAKVGTGGVASYTSSSIALTEVEYVSGSTTTVTTPSVSAPTMTVVGSKPALAVGPTGNRSGLSNTEVLLAEITVSADQAGDIRLGALPISVTSTGVATIASAADNIVVKDTNNTVVPTKNATFAVAAGGTGTATICFDTAVAACGSGTSAANGYLIAGGQSQTFRVYATAATVSGAVNTTSLSTKLGANTNVRWYDSAGADTTARNGSLIFNYPTTTSVITN